MTTVYHCSAMVFAGEGEPTGRNQHRMDTFNLEPFEKTQQRVKDEIVRWGIGELVEEPNLELRFADTAEYFLSFKIIPTPAFMSEYKSDYREQYVDSCLTPFSFVKPEKNEYGCWNNLLEISVDNVETFSLGSSANL
jgi:hypothetical protein